MFQKYKLFLFSENPDMLMEFYRDVLEMKVIKKLEYPKDYGYMLEVAPGYEVWIAKHTEVMGASREPVRTILNIYCDEIEKYYLKFLSMGVDIIQAPISMGEFIPGEERVVCTFHDPDGNCIQFMGKLR
jgi:hypothetical protein